MCRACIKRNEDLIEPETGQGIGTGFDEQQRRESLRDNLLGNTAVEQLANTAFTMRTHDNQVWLELPGCMFYNAARDILHCRRMDMNGNV
jgi:hypothetical protein